jgi:hypothetical protein
MREGRKANMGPVTAAGDAPQESVLVKKSSRASRKAGPHRYDLDDIAERMEIISPNDIELVKFLGAGGYGEVCPAAGHTGWRVVTGMTVGILFATIGSISSFGHLDT